MSQPVSPWAALDRARVLLFSLASALFAAAQDVEERDFPNARAVLLEQWRQARALSDELLSAWAACPLVGGYPPGVAGVLGSVQARSDVLSVQLAGIAGLLREQDKNAKPSDLVGDLDELGQACRLDGHAVAGIVEVLSSPHGDPSKREADQEREEARRITELAEWVFLGWVEGKGFLAMPRGTDERRCAYGKTAEGLRSAIMSHLSAQGPEVRHG